MFPRFCKVCALVAATAILPMLAYAKDDGGKPKDKGDKHVPVVPEANAGWALVPFIGAAVLLFSWRQISRAKRASQQNRS
jgi:hypothetical protein